MEETLQILNIQQFRSLFSGEFDDSLGEDFFLAEVQYRDGLEKFRHPFRFDGYLGFFCISGGFSLEINMKEYKVEPNSFLVSVPGYIMRIADMDSLDASNLHFVITAMSKDYMPSIRLDVTRLFNEGLSVLETPAISLSGEEYALCHKYLELAKDILDSQVSAKKEILGHLIASVMHVLSSVWTRKILAAKENSPSPSPRNKQVFEQFLKLVAEYHTQYRNMAFYADKMCLTPKYLSKLVKLSSGRSAPDWIDSFVILEAKNMLKYSEVPIKEIVFKLHFPNQSVFYKFFKSHTGQTPSEYRNS
ncbi:MAG: AraC family transcriptional regulator [Bacteroidales bacterium]|nr:AraC family transcriptional regulator [Bacteroidales bacterium]